MKERKQKKIIPLVYLSKNKRFSFNSCVSLSNYFPLQNIQEHDERNERFPFDETFRGFVFFLKGGERERRFSLWKRRALSLSLDQKKKKTLFAASLLCESFCRPNNNTIPAKPQKIKQERKRHTHKGIFLKITRILHSTHYNILSSPSETLCIRLSVRTTLTQGVYCVILFPFPNPRSRCRRSPSNWL